MVTSDEGAAKVDVFKVVFLGVEVGDLTDVVAVRRLEMESIKGKETNRLVGRVEEATAVVGTKS